MIEISFHRELYAADAVAEARKTYERFATIGLREEAHRLVLSIDAATEERAQRIAWELSNFALGLTVERAQRSSSV